MKKSTSSMNQHNRPRIAFFLNDPDFKSWVQNGGVDSHSKWTTWLDHHPEDREAMKQAILIQKGIAMRRKSLPDAQVSRALDKLVKTVSIREKTATRKRWINKLTKVAAAVIILVFSAWGMNQFFVGSNEIEVVTVAGEVKNHLLEDGTRVILNANSSLQYNRKAPREVWLHGEAYFEVSKKPQSGERFQVHTEDLMVEVLGTVFNVNSRNEATEVFLEEGKIKVDFEESSEESLLMSPGEVILYSKSSGEQPKKDRSSVEKETSWKDGVIYFENASLDEVLTEINGIYDLSIEVSDSVLEDKKINMPVPTRNEEIALEVLEKMTGLILLRENDKWILAKKE